jgi:hypothetical protein
MGIGFKKFHDPFFTTVINKGVAFEKGLEVRNHKKSKKKIIF